MATYKHHAEHLQQRQELHNWLSKQTSICRSYRTSSCYDRRVLLRARAWKPDVWAKFGDVASDGSIRPGSGSFEYILYDRAIKWALHIWPSRSCICRWKPRRSIRWFVQVEHRACEWWHQLVSHEHHEFQIVNLRQGPTVAAWLLADSNGKYPSDL